jgi:hypothetical protein
MGALLCRLPVTVTFPPATTSTSPPYSSPVMSTSPASVASASLVKLTPKLAPKPVLTARMGPFWVSTV